MAAFSAPGTGVARADQLVLRAAVSAYLGRYRGQTRLHTESDLNVFLRWCIDQDLDPLAVGRVDIERYVRWLQDVRRYQPSTVSRRLSIVVGFYRVCVIDQILPHSPADYVRRPTVPAESPTLGLGHLQFEALITTARRSANPNDYALVALLGLLGLRIFEACGANIDDLGEEHGHRVLRVRGKGGKVVLVPLPPAVARAIDRAADDRTDGPILRNTLGARMDRHAATRRLKHLATSAGIRMPRMHPHMLVARRSRCRRMGHSRCRRGFRPTGHSRAGSSARCHRSSAGCRLPDAAQRRRGPRTTSRTNARAYLGRVEPEPGRRLRSTVSGRAAVHR